MKITKIKIIIESSDNTKSEYTEIMPYEIASGILIDMLEWENLWVTTTRKHKEFIKSLKEFEK